MKHNHTVAGNTSEVYLTFVGCVVKGLLREQTFDGECADILVFECGWGLAVNSNGPDWIVKPEDVAGYIRRQEKEKKGITSPNCPTCGRYMDKVIVQVVKQIGKGTVEAGSIATGWVCGKCGLIAKGG